RDPFACERHDVESDGAEDAVAVVADVDDEGGLAVRSRVDEASSAWLSEDPCEVLGNGVEAAILERERRHVEAHIRGEHGDKAADLTPRESRRDAREELLSPRGTRNWRPVALPLAEPPLEPRTRAFERARHRFLRRLEHRRDLARPVTEHVMED